MGETASLEPWNNGERARGGLHQSPDVGEKLTSSQEMLDYAGIIPNPDH